MEASFFLLWCLPQESNTEVTVAVSEDLGVFRDDAPSLSPRSLRLKEIIQEEVGHYLHVFHVC